MPEFLAEQYEPGITEAVVRSRAAALQTACDELTISGVEVRLIGTHYAPSDEVVFIEIGAGSVQAVEETARRAGLTFDRVTETVSVRQKATRPRHAAPARAPKRG